MHGFTFSKNQELWRLFMGFAERRGEFGIGSRMIRPEGEASPGSHCTVIPKGTGLVHDFMDGDLRFEDLTHGADSEGLEASLVTAEPGVSCWEGNDVAGGKWYFILDGELEVLVNEDSHVLKKEDSIYVGPGSSHIWRNPTDKVTRILMFSSPPMHQIDTFDEL
jgi:quercetin dioxygenase-like cupin family protein